MIANTRADARWDLFFVVVGFFNRAFTQPVADERGRRSRWTRSVDGLFFKPDLVLLRLAEPKTGFLERVAQFLGI